MTAPGRSPAEEEEVGRGGEDGEDGDDVFVDEGAGRAAGNEEDDEEVREKKEDLGRRGKLQ